MKRLACLLIMVLLALPVSTALADDPPSNQGESSPSLEYTEIVGSPSASIIHQVGAWRIAYFNNGAWGQDALGRKYMQHFYAQTEKLAGNGAYKAEAHAALIKGANLAVQPVFSFFTHGCARSIQNNATARTCSSPWFATRTGAKWWIISGHYFDIGNNGSNDSTCDGCMDHLFTIP